MQGMQFLLFCIIMGQAMMIILLLFKTPLRKLIIAILDQFKRGRGPVVIKSVGATVFAVLCSTVYSAVDIRRRGKSDEGLDLNPTDQVLLANHTLDSSLMAFILFLALMIDRLHYYVRELGARRKTMESVKKSETKYASPEDVKAREQQVETFKDMIRQLDSELDGKVKEANASEATVQSLKKQTDGLVFEYDRLVAENQEIRNQLQVLDERNSPSVINKDL